MTIPFARSPLAAENIKAYRSLKAIIDKEGFSVIHAHTPVGGALARLCQPEKQRKMRDESYLYCSRISFL